MLIDHLRALAIMDIKRAIDVESILSCANSYVKQLLDAGEAERDIQGPSCRSSFAPCNKSSTRTHEPMSRNGQSLAMRPEGSTNAVKRARTRRWHQR